MNKLLTPLFDSVLPDCSARRLLDLWQVELETSSVRDILQWTLETFDSQVAFASSGSDEDKMLYSLLETTSSSVPSVDFIHKLLLWETWTPLKTSEILHPTFDGRTASAGLWERFLLEHLCKTHEKVIGRHRAWIVSARREQNALLEKMPVLSWSERFGVFRIAPLACWTMEHAANTPSEMANIFHPLPADRTFGNVSDATVSDFSELCCR